MVRRSSTRIAPSQSLSQFLALQLKARMEGIDTPAYELAPSHHKR